MWFLEIVFDESSSYSSYYSPQCVVLDDVGANKQDDGMSKMIVSSIKMDIIAPVASNSSSSLMESTVKGGANEQ